jgi:DNA polymerase-3 subunit delta'
VNWDGIIGQEDMVKSLTASIVNDRVGHAYVFSGEKGMGKGTVAMAFSGLLLCDKQLGDKMCGECFSCRMFREGSNPDFTVIEAGDGSISIDEIRSLQSSIIIRPLYSARKVYLILDAENMTVQAQNGLLKILEEPPPYAVIILTSSNFEALMETIRSRTVRYSFKKYSDDEIKKLLRGKFELEADKVDLIAKYSGGVPGTAVKLAESEDFVELRNKTIEVMLNINNSRLLETFEIYKYFEENKGNIDGILDIMLLMYRDLLVVKLAGGCACNENMLINSDKKDIILDNAEKFSVKKLVENIEQIEKTRRNINFNANYQISIEVMLMKLRKE